MTADGAVVGTALKPRRVLSIGITGHRPSRLDGCDLAALDAAIADLIERIAVATRVDSPGDICLVSSLAEGADSMVADAIAANVGLIIWWGQAMLKTTSQAPWPDILRLSNM